MLLAHHALDAVLRGGGDEDVQLVGAVLEHEESGTARDDAGALVRDALQDLRLGLEQVVGGEVRAELLDIAAVRVDQHADLGNGRNEGNEVGDPVLFLALELLDAAGGEVELFHQLPDQLLVAVADVQRRGQLAAHGASAGAELPADGDDEFLVGIHGIRWIGCLTR